MKEGLIEKYFNALPLENKNSVVTLYEGGTPLLELPRISRLLKRDIRLYAKYEGVNPTGSFKDRGMTVAVSNAAEKQCSAVVCASTGNTSASASAYAARAGMRSIILVPKGKVALGKMAQAMVSGALILQIDGNFDQGMELVKQMAQKYPLDLVNSVNPYRLQGQKTAAFEVVEDLGRPPDYHCLPVGNAGNISAYWMGYCEKAGKVDSFCLHLARTQLGSRYKSAVAGDSGGGSVPVMVGYQAEGAASMVLGKNIDCPETVATAIRIGNPQSRSMAAAAKSESRGWFASCKDSEILRAHRLLAEQEGVFCEPSSAVSIAGALKDADQGKFRTGSTIVCTLTGHGLKDPDTVMQGRENDMRNVKADFKSIEAVVAQYI